MKKNASWILLWVIFLFFSSLGYAEETSLFTLESSSFMDGGPLPVLYTCDGKDVPPQFSFKNIPPKTRYLGFVVADNKENIKAKYHWIIINIPSTTLQLHEATEKLPIEANLIRNSFNKMDYVGPCPPRGSAHEYIFKAFAYAEPITESEMHKVMTELENKGIEASMSGIYSRWFE